MKKQLNPDELLFDVKTLDEHSGDKWFASARPDAVALPRSTASVARILAFAHRRRIPVTARGAGHGYVGGCVPVLGGIALSLARLTQIKEINSRDFVAVADAGVVTQTLQDAVEARGLFFPPDPASRAHCTIGGNIATNAGGPRCLKYGVTRDYVLGLEVVLADGSIVNLGGRTHKNKTGFELARLFVGSEGMLGIVTQAKLKLLPLPPQRACLSAGFDSMKSAIRTIDAVFLAGFLPSALEVADAFTLAAAYNRTGSKMLTGCRAHLIVEIDGQDSSVRAERKTLEQIIKKQAPLFVKSAVGSQPCESIWQIRREFSYSLRDTGLTKLNQDIVVPRGKLDRLFRFTAQLQKKHQLPIACFGHAGDGNIHVNVMVDESAPDKRRRSKIVLDELFHFVLSMDGAITGEHGIGLAKKPWWTAATSPECRRLHATIKRAMDPLGILNPRKFL
ncbi:MAG: FAD-binding protein [Verrucomicrobia bacterium]|nr:FAD-binding protein [Verrucomicrobiota bacterium]